MSPPRTRRVGGWPAACSHLDAYLSLFLIASILLNYELYKRNDCFSANFHFSCFLSFSWFNNFVINPSHIHMVFQTQRVFAIKMYLHVAQKQKPVRCERLCRNRSHFWIDYRFWMRIRYVQCAYTRIVCVWSYIHIIYYINARSPARIPHVDSCLATVSIVCFSSTGRRWR